MATEEKTVVPTERDFNAFSLDDPATIELIHRAEQSVEADRQLTIGQALKKYKRAVFWAMLLSTALVMEGYDVVTVSCSLVQQALTIICLWTDSLTPQINSFFGQTQFQERFGTYDEGTNSKLITAPWQSGLANSALVGEIAGLAINSYSQDKFGCRPTMMVFMLWMAACIFIPFFAPSLPILAWGEAMCGISWGVFQVRNSLCSSLAPSNHGFG
jgi:MFS transporter, SP family, general alpha glucoside:H+ symporter